jgi:hypothetical protein
MGAVVRLVTFVEIRGGEDHGSDGQRMSVTARHDAELVDGRRVVLLDDRGWTGELRVAGGGVAEDAIWAYETQEQIEFTARAVVGPDEPFGERTRAEMESGHWDTLARILREQGIEAEPAELKALPHDVELSDRVRERLGGR